MKSVFHRYLVSSFQIDTRALGLFRIGLGLCLLGDLIVRSQDIRPHYTDMGVMPRTVLFDNFWYPGNLSLHVANGTVYFEAALFLAAAVCAAFLVLGIRTRLVTALSWFFLISLQNRNPLILQGGDILLRSLMFWSLFLPLGLRYSVDSLNKKRPPRAVLSVGTAAILLQVAILYWCTALLKSGVEWIPNGTAVYYALHIEEFAKPFGVWIRQFPEGLRLLTFGTWWLEALGPFLFFMPVAPRFFRALGIIAFYGLHLGLFFSMELGIFPFANALSFLPFLPRSFLDGLEFAADFLIVLFNRSWQRVSAFSLLPQWATETAGAFCFSAARFSSLASFSKASFGSGQPLAERTSKPWTRWVGEGLAAFFLAYVVLWNLGNFKWSPIAFPDSLAWVADLLRIDQVWDMFAPYPAREDGWYVIPGKLKDGSPVDVLHRSEGEPSWEAPSSISGTYTSDRWRSYMMAIWLRQNEKYRLYYAQYLCRSWNRDTPTEKQLGTFQIYFMSKFVQPNYQHVVPEKVLTWDHQCD